MSDVRFQKEILMQILRETGKNEDLTSVSIDEKMQIAQSLGIGVSGANKAEEIAADLTKELGLSSGGEEADEAGNDEATRITVGGLPDFNLDPDTFKHDNPAYQEIASFSNADVEQLLGLVHTQISILHAKGALKTIPKEEEEAEEDYYAGEGEFVDSMSTDGAADDEWLQVPSEFSLEDAAEDLRSKYKAAMAEPGPEDPVQKKISQFYRETLKMQKMQNVGLLSTIKALKDGLESTTSKQKKAMDTRIPPMTQNLMLERLIKESSTDRSIQDLTTKMSSVEKPLQLVLQNQITQANLLKNLFSTYSVSSSLPVDDNKKGEKEKDGQQIKDQHITD